MKNKMTAIMVTLLVLCLTSNFYYQRQLTYLDSKNTTLHSIKQDIKQEEEKKESKKLEKNNSAADDLGKVKDLKLYALSAVLMDADNTRVLYEKKGFTEMAMASTTKIMTCIIALENAKLDEVVTVSKYASTMPDVQLTIKAGERYQLKDLLYSLMLESHNDVAVAIAEHVGGSVEGFAALMNEKAKELGCVHTNFVTPNGLDALNHHTTAVELAKIASYAIKNKKFIDITNTASWQFTDVDKKRSFSVSNKDKFLYLYDGAIGIKTGFTNKAGYCFVGAVSKNDKTFISVVLGSGWPPNKSYKWRDTSNLMDYGMENYNRRQIFNADKKFKPIPVEDGQENYVGLSYEGDITLLMRKDEQVKIIYNVPKIMEAPVNANTPVGNASYYVGEDLIAEIPIYTDNDVARIDFEFCMKKIFTYWLVH